VSLESVVDVEDKAEKEDLINKNKKIKNTGSIDSAVFDFRLDRIYLSFITGTP